MDDNKTFFTQVQAPVESETVAESMVKLPRTWVFWENYEAKSGKLDYALSLKKILEFNDIITFWQFWNAYPGSDTSFIFYNGERLRYFFDEKYRINGLNLFVEGVSPKWEDPLNKGGKYFTLEYQIKDELDQFLPIFSESWLKLMLSVIGESIDAAQYINGVRFVDKTLLGKKNMYRMEVWCHKDAPADQLVKLRETIKMKFQSEPIEKTMS